jgi:tellurite resistance protein
MRTPLWRQTPPAIFPVTLGFLGLGLAWRKAAGVLDLPMAIGDVMLGVATMFLAYFLVLYAMKLAARPAVLLEDMKAPPARAGVSALAMSLMLLAAVALQYGVRAPWLLWLGIVTYVAVAALILRMILNGGPEGRVFSPFQYLTFVGLIVVPIAGLPLGMVEVSIWLSMLSLAAFVVITAGYGRKVFRVLPPQPLRPSLVIVLAPVSLFAMLFAQLGWSNLFQVFYWLAVAVAFLALFAGRWLMAGGWTPLWGAFTFPLAAFANLQVVAVQAGIGRLAEALLVAGLTIATPLILYVVYHAGRAWTRGELSKKSGAATA